MHHLQNKLSEGEASELKLDSYLMQIHQTLCTHCDSGERYGELYEVWIHPTKTRTTGYRQLRRFTGSHLQALPIAYIEMPEREIPICSDCVQTADAGTSQQISDPAAWAETLKRKYAPIPKEVKVARSAGASSSKHIPTLDEL